MSNRRDTPHVLDPERIRHGLATRRIGRRVIVLDEVDSTNLYALNVLADRDGRDADGAVIFAEFQTAGRGRMGRIWHAPRASSLTFSVLLWEDFDAAALPRRVMAAALAVAAGIDDATHIRPVIRWPNDLFVNSRKLCGILAEARHTPGRPVAVALGVGINCLQQRGHFPPQLQDRATSLELESAQPIDREAVARAVIQRLDACFADPAALGEDELARAWREATDDIGRRATLACGGETFEGVILDVSPRDGLLLQLDTGARRIFDAVTTMRVK